jgi:hypothetical protein
VGSFSDLRIAGYSVVSRKYRNDPQVLSIFVEADKVNSRRSPDSPPEGEPDDDDYFSGYCASAIAITDRLELMGFTEAAAREDFALTLKGEIADTAELWSDNSHPDDQMFALLLADKDAKLAFLSELSFDEWIGAVGRIRAEHVRWQGYNAETGRQEYSRALDPLEAFILNEKYDDEQPPLGYFCSDLRFLIRAYLLSAKPEDSVVLDNSDMVNACYFAAEDQIVERARTSIAAEARTVEKLLVLTEGSSDSRVLQETLDVRYPHLKEFVSFLDHGQFSVAGGTGNLMNLLRGLAGASVSNRVVALFDNDAAGTVQCLKARTMPLPQNFRVIQLPHLPRAERYPTLGPTGLVETDINGLACSLELYLGATALRDGNAGLMPIQWTGFERSLSKYQGELLDKRAVQDRYFELLRAGRAETSDIDAVFGHILRSFHQ